MGNSCACIEERKSERHSESGQPFQSADYSSTRVLSKYSVRNQLLGSGRFGVVRKAVCRATGEKFAIKKIPKRKLNLTLIGIQSERKGLLALDHPNIIKYYELLEDERNFYEVMQLATGKDVINAEDGLDLTEAKIAEIMKSAFSAVSYLHSKGIIHRDLKPNNFKFASEEPNAELVLLDFGFSRVVEDHEILETTLGTPYYFAPEVIRKSYDLRSDYWSLGVMMHLLLVTRYPFVGMNFPETLRKIQEAELQLEGPEWDVISSEAKDLLRKLLAKNPYKRITADEALEHTWIRTRQNANASSKKSQQNQEETAENIIIESSTVSDMEKNDAKVKLDLDEGSTRNPWTSSTETSPGKTVETRQRDLNDIFVDSATSNQNLSS